MDQIMLSGPCRLRAAENFSTITYYLLTENHYLTG
jgi:hypothetical protein